MGWPWGQSWAHHDGMPVPIVTPTAPWLGSLVGLSPSHPLVLIVELVTSPQPRPLAAKGQRPWHLALAGLRPRSQGRMAATGQAEDEWGLLDVRLEGVCSQSAASPGRLPDSSHWPGRLWKLLEGAGPLPLSHLGPGAAWPLLAEGAGEWAGPGWCCSWIHVCPGGRDWPGEGPGSVCCMSVRAGGDVPQSVPGLCPQAVLRTGLA